jgi:MFS family permease
MTLRQDLHLQGNDFSNLVSATYVAIAVWGIPTIYLLQRFPVAKYMAANVVLWGVATACGAAAHDYRTMLVTRVFLGIFEATINPSLMLISGRWYTKPEQAPRFSFWLVGLGVGQILGGAVSYGFQHVVPTESTLSGWRIMFVLLGLVTVVFGILTWFFLPDTPMEAPWLSDGEKVALLKHISVNQTGVEDRKVIVAEIWEALRDPQVWLLWLSVILVSFCFCYFCILLSLGGEGMMDDN